MSDFGSSRRLVLDYVTHTLKNLKKSKISKSQSEENRNQPNLDPYDMSKIQNSKIFENRKNEQITLRHVKERWQ